MERKTDRLTDIQKDKWTQTDRKYRQTDILTDRLTD